MSVTKTRPSGLSAMKRTRFKPSAATLKAKPSGRFNVKDFPFESETRFGTSLKAPVFDGAERVFDVLAFNEVVASKGIKGSMIELEVRIDGKFLYALRADGLIVATPTGSTAYALSSGGPIIHPSISAMALVPICPHTFSSRPIVISSDSVVEIIVKSESDTRAHFDSHSRFDLREGYRVVIRRYAHTIRLLHPVGHDYYNMLRAKLHWTEFY